MLDKFTENYPKHGSQFSFTDFNKKCIDVIYDDLGKKNEIKPRTELFSKIEGLKETCSSCYSFYMRQRTRSAKFLDIKLGQQFENAFIDFLNDSGIPSEIQGKPLNYPDIVIKNKSQETIARCELKYLTAPYLLVYKAVPGRECYEGSNTLDVGEKITKQRNFVENEITVPVFYIFWLDYPCVKGIFYMTSKQVYTYIDSVGGMEYERKEREGDFINTSSGKKKMGQTKKVYLPLYQMKNFESLMTQFQALIK